MKNLIIAVVVAASLTACAGVQFNKDGSWTTTMPDGSVCTENGAWKSCGPSPAQLAKREQRWAAGQQAQQEQQAADQAARDAKVEADRQKELAWENSPEGKASMADWEAKQAVSKAEYAADEAAKRISIYKRIIRDAEQGLAHEREVEAVSGVIDMSERRRYGNDIVTCNEGIKQFWATYKANGGMAKSVDDIE
jgi:hypothetical protein